MKQSDSIAQLAAALVLAQADLRAVGTDSVNPHFKNRYASLDAIIASVRPVLAKHGLAIAQAATTPDRDEAGRVTAFTVETMLIHTSGEWLTGAAIMPLAKADPQGAGGALTYGRRYGLTALLGISTDEDDDGNVASAAPVVDRPRYPAQIPATHNASAGLRAAPGNATSPVPVLAGVPQGAILPTPHGREREATPPASTVAPLFICPKCGGTTYWDNRGSKLNPNSPDFKCKVQGCGGAIWLDAKKPTVQQATRARPVPAGYVEVPPPARNEHTDKAGAWLERIQDARAASAVDAGPPERPLEDIAEDGPELAL